MTLPMPIAFLDVESDGLRRDRKPWEVAVIRREPDGTHTEWQTFVQINLDEAEPMGLRVGGFYDRHPLGRHLSQPWTTDEDWEGEPEPDTGIDAAYVTGWDAARIVAHLTHGALIVGAVPSFDADILGRLLREHLLVDAWKHRVRCVETLTAGFLRREVGGLSDCAAALGIEHPDAHTALGDARTAMAIWDHVMGSHPAGADREAVEAGAR